MTESFPIDENIYVEESEQGFVFNRHHVDVFWNIARLLHRIAFHKNYDIRNNRHFFFYPRIVEDETWIDEETIMNANEYSFTLSFKLGPRRSRRGRITGTISIILFGIPDDEINDDDLSSIEIKERFQATGLDTHQSLDANIYFLHNNHFKKLFNLWLSIPNSVRNHQFNDFRRYCFSSSVLMKELFDTKLKDFKEALEGEAQLCENIARIMASARREDKPFQNYENETRPFSMMKHFGANPDLMHIIRRVGTPNLMP
jgi:hypothetical protein